MELSDVHAVLFDMDGTLVDSDAVVDRSWSQWAEEYGVPVADVLAIAHGSPAEVTIGRMRPDLSPAERAEAVARVLDIESSDVSDVVATPGAPELTALLDRLGIPWAVYTSASTRLAKVRLDAVGITPSILVTLDDVTHGKPNPEGYLRAAELLGVPADQCLVVEDTTVGLAAGKASGALTAGLKGIPADIRLTTLHELVDLLGSTG
ncbi:HAD-IA family hydrolase [Kribbella sp. NPDC026611]|uniref:HAD-IA family hydrolase n=1 Tax=Kribbella sp. NPDC026611 TaxID=3154911 RepID=UPI0033E99F03